MRRLKQVTVTFKATPGLDPKSCLSKKLITLTRVSVGQWKGEMEWLPGVELFFEDKRAIKEWKAVHEIPQSTTLDEVYEEMSSMSATAASAEVYKMGTALYILAIEAYERRGSCPEDTKLEGTSELKGKLEYAAGRFASLRPKDCATVPFRKISLESDVQLLK